MCIHKSATALLLDGEHVIARGYDYPSLGIVVFRSAGNECEVMSRTLMRAWLQAERTNYSKATHRSGARFAFGLIYQLFGGSARRRFEIEFAFAFLVEHTIASRPTAAYMHPIGRHHHDRPRAEIFG